LHYAAFAKDIWVFQFICYFLLLSHFAFLTNKNIRSKIKLDTPLWSTVQVLFSALILWITSGSVYFYFYLIHILCKWYIRISNSLNNNEKLDNQ
jgi:hypothetical protein